MILKNLFPVLALSVLGFQGTAQHQEEASESENQILEHDHAPFTSSDEGKVEGFNINDVIMHHVKDAHDWHIMDIDDHAVSIPLPVILYTENGLVTFSSSEFHHDDDGRHVVEKDGERFVKFHEKIYYASTVPGHDGRYLDVDHESHKVSNAMPMDFSITKNVLSMFIGLVVILLMFTSVARFYKKNGAVAPRGFAGFMEPLILFVVNDIARDNIGPKYRKYLPYLLTLFFFIWINNMLGLVPFFPGGANLTGNISVTLTLAVTALIVVNFSGNKDYWKHIFATPGVPLWLYPIMIPVEIIGIFTKPFALMVRLFANITAGHIVVLSLVSLIFIFETVWISPASMILALFINVLELLVAFLQAFIFTMLTALFIGQAVAEHDHDHAEAH